MLTAGNILRRAREQEKKTLEDVAQTTRIKLEYLQKIEKNEFDFVGSTFIKGFIRSYANFLNLDAEGLVAIYRRQVGEEEKPIKANLKKVKTEGFVVTPLHVISAGLAVFFIVIIGILVVQFYRLQQPPRLEFVSPKDLVFETDKRTLEIKGATEEQTIVALNGNQIQLKPDKTFSLVIDLNPGDNVLKFEAWKQNLENKKTTKTIIAKLTTGTTSSSTPQNQDPQQEYEFTVQSTAEAWVQIIADNTQLAVGVVPNNYNRKFKAKTTFTVTTGKPNNTKLLIGTDVKPWTIKNGVGTLTCSLQSDNSWQCK